MRPDAKFRPKILAAGVAILLLGGLAVAAERHRSALADPAVALTAAPQKERLQANSRRLDVAALADERASGERVVPANAVRVAAIDTAPGKWKELLQPVPGEKVNRRDTTGMRAEMRKFRDRAAETKWKDRSPGTDRGKFLQSESVDKVWRPPVRVVETTAENR